MSYSKTTWANLPNQTTPVNATNMNKIENQLEKLNPDIIQGALVSDYTIPTTHAYSTIPFVNGYKLGNNMSISNGEITIGSNVSAIKVSSTLEFVAGSTGETKYVEVMKNDNVVLIQRNTVLANEISQIVITPLLITVSSGDKIKIQVYGTNTDKLNGSSRTHCLIEKVE